MKKTNFEQYTSGWTVVDTNLRPQLYQVLEWCWNYPSEKRFYVDYDERKTNCPLCIRFESQEDAVMFMMIWLGIDM